jgi:hypothetical protein
MGKTNKKCEGTYIDAKCKQRKCRRFAVTSRKWWRFGGQNEPAVVDYYTHLCARCAELFDESRREAESEARGS